MHVVDEGRAGFDGGFGDGGLVRVDADRDVELAHQPLDDRYRAAQLLVLRDLGEARPRRLPADVDDVRAVVAHLHRLAQRGLDVTAEAVAGERVRRHVDDAHHVRPRAPGELAPADRYRCRGDGG